MRKMQPNVEGLEERLTPSTYKQSNLAYGTDPAQVLDVASNTSYTNAPIVVLVHGGGWTSGDKTSIENQYSNYFLSQGFVVVAPNYRLVKSNGSGGYTNQFPIPVEDVASAISWAEKNAATYHANANEVVLLGVSSGTQLASMIAYDPTGFSGAVNWGQAAPLKVAGFIGDSGVYDWPLIPTARTQVPAYLGSYYGDPHWDVAEAITYASAVPQPPALVIDGTSDTYTNYQNSTAFVNALQAAGNKVTYQLYPGYTHIEFSDEFRSSTAEQTVVTNYLKTIGL